jgi:hypothetical protein
MNVVEGKSVSSGNFQGFSSIGIVIISVVYPTTTVSATTITTTTTMLKLFADMVFQHCLHVVHVTVSCYLGRLSHFKILKVADDMLFGSNSKLI